MRFYVVKFSYSTYWFTWRRLADGSAVLPCPRPIAPQHPTAGATAVVRGAAAPPAYAAAAADRPRCQPWARRLWSVRQKIRRLVGWSVCLSLVVVD